MHLLHHNVRALTGKFRGDFRLLVGKWRILFRLLVERKIFYVFALSRIFHVPDAFICPDNGISASLQQALRGAAVVFYCKPLIRLRRASAGHVTQLEDPVENGEMGASGSAQRVKIIQLKKKKLNRMPVPHAPQFPAAKKILVGNQGIPLEAFLMTPVEELF